MQYDVISFDIFDTLIMRKIYYNEDIFRLVEHKLSKEFGNEFTYIDFRRQAIKLLKEPTIDDIFAQLQELTKWNDQKVKRIKECEIETDLHLMAPRKKMVKICNKALEEKNVPEAFDYAHTLKGVFANLGLTPMFVIIEQIVEQLRSGSAYQLEQPYEALLEANENLKRILGM
mgnify:CR=1 FL=1